MRQSDELAKLIKRRYDLSFSIETVEGYIKTIEKMGVNEEELISTVGKSLLLSEYVQKSSEVDIDPSMPTADDNQDDTPELTFRGIDVDSLPDEYTYEELPL